MPIIRSLTLHLGRDGSGDLEDVAKKFYVCSKDIRPWTLRITLSNPLCSMEALCQVAEKYDLLIHVGDADEYEMKCGKRVPIEGCQRLYSSTVCESSECLKKALRKLWNTNAADPTMFTRYAVLVGGPVRTPYFPALRVQDGRQSIGIALRYVDVFPKLTREANVFVEWVLSVYSKAERVAKCVGAEEVYIDLSLSPWMEESVARVLESLAGTTTFGSVGSLAAVRRANEIIERLREILEAKGVSVGGFNEVMLAVAEDNYLDELVERGDVRLRDLVAYTTVCVAGLDMVAVPKGLVEPEQLAEDLWASYTVRRRPLGVRVIPVNAVPGSRIALERFGETHVAKV